MSGSADFANHSTESVQSRMVHTNNTMVKHILIICTNWIQLRLDLTQLFRSPTSSRHLKREDTLTKIQKIHL